MTIFGIGPLELVMILFLGLIVFGPERLPEIARFLGKLVARVLAWQHASPEAQMIQQLRRDVNQEIISLRDEMIRARQQFDLSAEVQQIHQETSAALKDPLTTATASKPTIRAASNTYATGQPVPSGTPTGMAQTTNGVAGGSPATAEAPASTPAATVRPDVKTLQPPDIAAPVTVDLPRPPIDNVPAPDTPVPPEVAALTAQIQTLVTDFHALLEQLRARGLLDADWQPPSQTAQQEINHS